jgi:recombinational DNA repair protein (RecF pathway)
MKKCENCGSPIPHGGEAYLKGKIVCQTCWSHRKPNDRKVQEAYEKWIEMSKENE